ncbi:hypothetical protein PSN45_005261 [Yamadazyma tenuis]|uniref:Uncharacterized protein n=1 Tax=Candida tenuis (strain ATCC 10573 / BCRC 21748 / CBS 615 / JCM 9827 / NBRC 10315 / NRRL Y-1498 / VKM Y-70) TaxID=590646 RepID=G3B189_CANTC|nr:uncharacterized protein CANTEDRAFT_113667 [Yamadazyma tenuis ATCC 10573]EGV64909.1 hypothetical protein CANTEDRAFT_113667 [Yamadazyma tenuis ATCC 10573]WEJ97703.1 hypothetical protein PSN45_005261 [Yamadazyma tenuis]
MFRLSRSSLQNFKRFNSHSAHPVTPTPSKAPFNNKYNFNTSPPPVHEYWNIRNTSFLLAFIPLYFAVSYVTKNGVQEIEGFGGLVEFAKGEKSPLKEIKFGEPQLPTKN